MKLRKKTGCTFNRACYQLGKKHDVDRVSQEVLFRFLLVAINVYDVAQALKRMKTQAYGQQYFECFERIIPADKRCQVIVVNDEKIVILENE